MAYPIQLILIRQLAGYLSVPLFLVDPKGSLLFYNEPAEVLLWPAVVFHAVNRSTYPNKPVKFAQVSARARVCREAVSGVNKSGDHGEAANGAPVNESHLIDRVMVNAW